VTREYALMLLQGLVVVVLGACVAMGHDSAITDGLMAISGSIVGIGVYEKVKAK